MRRTWVSGIAVVLLMSASLGWVAAQSGSRGGSYPSGGTTQGSAQRPQVPFEVTFWNYLQESKYKNWAPLPGQSDAAYTGNSPHGEKVKLYANRPAAGRSAELPLGSILIKENYDASETRLMAITVMYRSKGFAPESGDWYWIKYEPDGRSSMMNGMPVAGKVSMCIECHKSAGGGDFVFANDQKNP